MNKKEMKELFNNIIVIQSLVDYNIRKIIQYRHMDKYPTIKSLMFDCFGFVIQHRDRPKLGHEKIFDIIKEYFKKLYDLSQTK